MLIAHLLLNRQAALIVLYGPLPFPLVLVHQPQVVEGGCHPVLIAHLIPYRQAALIVLYGLLPLPFVLVHQPSLIQHLTLQLIN